MYISFEEFKGREPIVRNGQVIPVKVHDFDNPFLRHYYEGQTGGTTGAGTRVAIDLDHLAAHGPLSDAGPRSFWHSGGTDGHLVWCSP